LVSGLLVRCAACRRSFFFQAEDGIRYRNVTGVQTCALPIFRVIEMPTDPDTLAKQIYDLDTRYPGLESRPDFEVVPIFEEIIREARDRDGVTHVISGIGDSAIHLLGRKMEIRGRYGRMGKIGRAHV